MAADDENKKPAENPERGKKQDENAGIDSSRALGAGGGGVLRAHRAALRRGRGRKERRGENDHDAGNEHSYHRVRFARQDVRPAATDYRSSSRRRLSGKKIPISPMQISSAGMSNSTSWNFSNFRCIK